ncbi:alpha/beta-hydrolase [Meredithblackwellia eburnea MCA 4105]
MGFIRLPGKGETNIFYDLPVGPLDPAKETIVLLSPTMHTLCFLKPFWQCPALKDRYNFLCLDLRSHGRTKSLPTPTYDFGVAAADVALCLETLGLSHCHIYAPGVASFLTGIKLVLLFPSRAKTITFAGVCALFGYHPAIERFTQIDRCTQTPEDVEDFEEGVRGLLDGSEGSQVSMRYNWGTVDCMFNDQWHTLDKDMIDTIATILTKTYTPGNSLASREHFGPMRMSSGLEPESLVGITTPILVFHSLTQDGSKGGKDVAHPPPTLDETISALQNSGAQLTIQVIPGAPHTVDLTHLLYILNHFTEFIDSHSSAPHPEISLETHQALSTISYLTSNPKVMSRDPNCPDSYTFLSDMAIETEAMLMEELARRENSFTLDLPALKNTDVWDYGDGGFEGWRFTERDSY